ncbi:hypothetical protein E2C01_035289 [Portunus trituberculatus]|uniref:Uncharacterized protein n=1 Tax=Portunus trituberculatus TaxID=210409 RepID=A0A5B7F8Y6_PORTR|nr:hypothetical protein [Portunus trituberculatus]
MVQDMTPQEHSTSYTLNTVSKEDSRDHLLEEGDWRPRGRGCVRGCLGVEGILGGEESGVRNWARAMRSRKPSSWRRDKALWRVSSGRMDGTPPRPSRSATQGKSYYCDTQLFSAMLDKFDFRNRSVHHGVDTLQASLSSKI